MVTQSSTVIPLRAPSRLHVPADLTSPVYQLTVVRRLSREWRAALSGTEYLILSYIVDHTILWGRPAYRFTYRAFEEGTRVSPAGTGLGKTQVWSTLKSLMTKGVIACVRLQSGTEITIDPEWKPMGLPTPRRVAHAQRSDFRTSDVHSAEPQMFGNPNPLLEEHLDEQDSGSSWTADAAEPMASGKNLTIPVPSKKPEVRIRTRPTRTEIETPAPVAPVREKVVITEQGELFTEGKTLVSAGTSIPERQRHSAAQAELHARRSMKNPGALFETWEEAWGEAYHDVPGARCLPWGKREAGMVKNTLALQWAGKPDELHDFLDWAVINWPSIMVEQFAWMTREPAPPLPSIKFLISFRDNFIRAFGKRSIDKALDALSGHERMIRKAMLKDGLTHEEAMVKLAERRARQQLREEIEQGKAEVAQQRRTVSAERAGLERERRELERRMSETLRIARESAVATAPVKAAREVSDEELAQSVQLVAKMMEVDPEAL